ncbi:MAG: 3'-5' exonuclease, partial [Bacteroidota bacterium]
IYRWRGAEIRNILDFQKDYPEAVVVPLEQNYRSTKTIISAADSVIKKNTHQLKKTLWTDNPEGELIEIIECDNDGQEADVIVNLVVKAKTESDFKPEDFAVLYRTNAQSLALEKSFIKENIPYVIVGGTSFYQRKEIKDTLAYFKILINPSDSESLLRVVNEPPRGIGLTSLKHLRTFAQDNKKSLFDVFEIAHKVPELQTRAVTAVKKFIEFVKSYEIKRLKLPPEELAVDFIEESGLLQMYKDINTEESLDKWNNIQQLLSDMQEFFRKEENANIEEYLQQVTLITDLDKKDINQKQVKMMTLHSAKGLEFPVVVISGVEHGLFPLAKAEMHPEEEEEERRLFYVGITRAMEKLYITYAYKRLRFGEYRDSMPSKFIKEIDAKFLQHKTATVGQKQNFANGSFPTISKNKTYSNNSNFNKTKNYSYGQTEQATPASDTTYPFKVGDRVNHAHFGAGKVLAMTGVGQNAKAVVDFKGVGRKVLMLQFAKLEKIS